MIEELIYNYWDSEFPAIIQRQIKPDIETNMISDIVGVRRAGKTYLMLDIASAISKDIGKKATIYINFESRRLLPLTPDYFNQIISFIYRENIIETYRKVYLFLDEIQRIEGWERFIRSIYDEFKGRIKIFVSGSSANLLSQEYGKLLTGRHLTTEVFPLSFKEFIKFKRLKADILSERKIAQIKKALKEYLEFGGFPEVVLAKQKAKKEEILNQLFSDILSRDILRRAVRKEQIIEEFSYFLSSNTSCLLSFNKMAGYFKSRGIKISVPTLGNYFYLMKNAFLFFDVSIFSYKIKDQLQYPRKIYCVDNGLVSLTGFSFILNPGKLYENTVAVELFRRFTGKPGLRVFYWKSSKGEEVDFVIKEKLKIKELIQVSYAKEEGEIKERETRNLFTASKELDCKNLLLITADYETKISFKGNKIKAIPLWKWLLRKA